jgi:VanZ family protein
VTRPDGPSSLASPPPARRAVHWMPALVWAALIFAVSSIGKLPDPPTGITDKHAHVTVYGVLAALIVWALTAATLRRTTWRTAAVAVVLATLYGVTDEWHQSFVPGRSVSGLDLIADALGATLAAVGLRAWAIIQARR